MVWPIHSDWAPTSSPEMAAVRIMPAVCAIELDSSAPRISRRRDLDAGPRSGILGGIQGQRDRVDAPPLIGRDIVPFALEHMPQMRAAVGTPHFGPDPARGPVLEQDDCVTLFGLVEAGPATV